MGTPDSVLIRYLKTKKLFRLPLFFERSSSPEFTSHDKRIRERDDERSLSPGVVSFGTVT